MKILYVTSEYYPLTRVDDVADFAASLTQAIGQLAHDVRVILPGYPDAVNAALPVDTVTTLEFSGCEDTVRLLKGNIKGIDFPVYLVEAPAMFSRHGHPYLDVQGNPRIDNLKRFAMFSQAVSMIALNHAGMNWKPDLVHCNDWQTGLIPALLAEDWNRPATVFSCHHISDEDLFSQAELEELKLPAHLKSSSNTHTDGRFSPSMSGIQYSDAVVTTQKLPVDINKEYQQAFDSRQQRVKLIQPAADDSRWDPSSDSLIRQPFDSSTFDLKLHNKRALQASHELDENDKSCLLAIFGNVTDDPENQQHIQLPFVEQLLELDNVQLILSSRLNQPTAIESLGQQYPGRLAIDASTDEKDFHRLIAGSDAAIFPRSSLMTRLTPQICCRYGTVPMLSDQPAEIAGMTKATSETLMQGKACGFIFPDNTTENAYPTAEKLVKYHGRSGPWWKKLAVNCMETFQVNQQNRLEFTQQYLECYQFAIDNPASNPDQQA